MPAAVTLPTLSFDRPLRLTPTDVSQFVRQEQCERFLRFRLAERAGQKFMEEYDANPQRITPLLTLSGHRFETTVEDSLAAGFRAVNYAKVSAAHDRAENNAAVADEARRLKSCEALLLFQARLHVELGGWHFRGDLDLVRLERTPDGTLRVLIADMKSTDEAKVEHRLQVAFYRLMLEQLLADAGDLHRAAMGRRARRQAGRGVGRPLKAGSVPLNRRRSRG